MSENNQQHNDNTEGLVFPTEYPVKVMGANTEDFFNMIFNTIKSHASEISRDSVHIKTSSNGKYQSITILVYALSRDHLINIYSDIRKIKGVLWTL